jgi:LysR family transcriptional regulator, glycine cleavage system transcriptional activator
VLNPVSYWLDRPAGAGLRPAAADLARRIGAEAGLERESVERFLAAAR